MSTKYGDLREIDEEDIRFPTYATISHAVCASDGGGCGWAGFLLEGVFEVDGQRHHSGTGDKVLPAVTNQICPCCGELVFRTYRRTYTAGP